MSFRQSREHEILVVYTTLLKHEQLDNFLAVWFHLTPTCRLTRVLDFRNQSIPQAPATDYIPCEVISNFDLDPSHFHQSC